MKPREWGMLEEVGVLRSSVMLMMLEFECEMSPPSNLEEGKYVLTHIFMGKDVGSYNVYA